MQLPDHRGDLHVALTDRRHQVRRIIQIQRLGDLVEIVLGRSGNAPAPQLALEDLLSDALRGPVLFTLEHLADLVARAPRADVREPVARRLRGRRPDDLDRLRVAQRT